MFSALSLPAHCARLIGHPWIYPLALTLAATCAGVNVHAQPILDLDEALRVAEQRSRQLVAQDAAAAASREMGVAAGKRPDPTLKLGVINLPISGADAFNLTRDFMTMAQIGVMQEFTREDKLRARTTRFEREAETAEAARSVALANLRRDTAIAWLERYYQEKMLAILRTQRTEAVLQIEAADATYRAGRGAQADLFAARGAVAQIDDQTLLAERRIATAGARLERWVGEYSRRALGPAPDLAAVRLEVTNLAAQLADQPQIAMLRRQEEVARAGADVARSNKRADWTAELMYSQRGPGYSNMVSFNLSIPLQLDQKNRQDRDVAATLALAEQAREQREEALREMVAETHAWLLEWRNNRERLAHHDAKLLPLATERSRAALASYRAGSGPLAAVLEARRMEIEIHIDHLRIEMETARAWAQLEYLLPAARATRPRSVPVAQSEK